MILRPYQAETIKNVQSAFMQGSKRPLISLPCGSGKTVLFAYMASKSQDKHNTVWFLVHRQELLSQTLETFERFGIPLNTIHIGMITTYANHLERYPRPDFIIFDEAHFSMANTWGKIIRAFPDAYIIGLTATPVRLDGKPLGTIYDKLIKGVTTRELIDLGYLAPYRYFAPGIADLSGLKRKGSDFDKDQASEILMKKAIYGDVIKNYRKYANNLQTICYCASIKHSESMAEEFRAAGINAMHFDGNTPDKVRKQIIQDFRDGKITILCNVDLISVGFDVPDCHCCMLLRPTMSTALFIQQAMRALRPQPNKTAIILDHVDNFERHGLPDDDREWSLDNELKQRVSYDEEGRLLVRQCLRCYFTFRATPVCPNCGFKAEPTRRELENFKEIQLREIKRKEDERKDNYKAICKQQVAGKGIDDCKNLSEIMAWCKQSGKKPGYGYIVAKKRGLVKG